MWSDPSYLNYSKVRMAAELHECFLFTLHTQGRHHQWITVLFLVGPRHELVISLFNTWLESTIGGSNVENNEPFMF